MKRLFMLGAITTLLVTMVSMVWAATVKSSKSNSSERVLMYSTPIVTPAQVTAILAELDKMDGGDEAAVRGLLKKHGVKTGCGKGCINHVKVHKVNTFLVLEYQADEAQALAVTVKGSKSLSSQ